MPAMSTTDPKIDLPKLIAKAQKVLNHNDTAGYIVPSLGLYPHQVLWDSCFIAIGLSHYDLARAKRQIEKLFAAQWSNGMIPHIIFNDQPRYWWDKRIWRSWLSPQAPANLATSGLSQPPMLAEAIVRIGAQLTMSDRVAWYKQVFPKLVTYHKWLYGERDPRSGGLVLQLHPWETGLDTCPPCVAAMHAGNWPRWLNILEIPVIDTIGDHFRVDNKYAKSRERSSNAEAIALYRLLRQLRHRRYNTPDILKNTTFAIQDITYNSILILANTHLQAIADTINTPLPLVLQRHLAKAAKALENLWSATDLSYYSRDFKSNELIKIPSIGSLLPLYSGAISPQRAAQLVSSLNDTASYALAQPIPSVPANSPWYSSDRYWQGPTWVNTNWLIIDGLKRYGYHEQAQLLTNLTLQLVSQHGFYEYFDPGSGAPHGANNFSWTAALIIDLASH
jgi:hypothetical protein